MWRKKDLEPDRLEVDPGSVISDKSLNFPKPIFSSVKMRVVILIHMTIVKIK